jgi:hypothetical protein
MMRSRKCSRKISGLVTSLGLLIASPSKESTIVASHEPSTSQASDIETCEGLCGRQPSSETTLGQFLESEIANRVERVSNRSWTLVSRVRFARELSRSIAEASYEHDIDPFLILAIVEVESRYNTMAIGSVGERGLMQIRPSTARWIVKPDSSIFNCDLHDVRCNILTGTLYLVQLEKQSLKRKLTFSSQAQRQMFLLLSYNLGPARAYKTLSESNSSQLPLAPALADQLSTPSDQLFSFSGFSDRPRYDKGETSRLPSYAEKVTIRANRFQAQYLKAATSTNQVVTTVALAN